MSWPGEKCVGKDGTNQPLKGGQEKEKIPYLNPLSQVIQEPEDHQDKKQEPKNGKQGKAGEQQQGEEQEKYQGKNKKVNGP